MSSAARPLASVSHYAPSLSRSFSTHHQTLPPVVTPQRLKHESEVLLYDAAYSLARFEHVKRFHRRHGRTHSLNADIHFVPQFREELEVEVGLPTSADAASVVALQQGITGIGTARNMQSGMFVNPSPLAFTMDKFITPMQEIFQGKPRPNWQGWLNMVPDYMPAASAGVLGVGAHIWEDFDHALQLQNLHQPDLFIDPGDWGNSYGIVGPAAQMTNNVLLNFSPFTTFKLLECPVIQYGVFKLRNAPFKRYLKYRKENNLFLPEDLDEDIYIPPPEKRIVDESATALLLESSHIKGIQHQARVDYEKDHGKSKYQ
jgi:hypothetical protein